MGPATVSLVGQGLPETEVALNKRNPASRPPAGQAERETYVAELKQLYRSGELVDWLDRKAASVPDRLIRELMPGLMPPEPGLA